MAKVGLQSAIRSYLLFPLLIFLATLALSVYAGKKSKADDVSEPEKWKKKDVRDYNDADVERLFDQWEDADEEELPEDELPEWKKTPPKIDLSSIDPNDPEGMLKATKKGRTLMMFASVSGNPTEKETEDITRIWQTSLFNAHIETQRYVVGANRVLFMLKDGAVAWDIKNFLIQQDRCESVTVEGQDFPGKGGKQDSKEDSNAKKPSPEQKPPKQKKTKPTKKKVKEEELETVQRDKSEL